MGAALRAELLAVAPKSPDIKVFPVASPLQCPAIDYGSSFSRAVEVDQPGQRRLYVSGTASIAPGGATAYVDDLRGQIDLTMNVVEAILASRTMSWKNVTRGVAYLKQITYTKPFGEYLSQRGLEFLPFTLVHADICRDDLLFEIELDAMVS
jgi:enamine deaminase RidA (YjgF/YER057c/UK114 family)